MFTALVSRREVLLLAVLATGITLAAAWLYPIWDDARLLILIDQHGNDAIRADMDSRVLVSAFLVFLWRYNLFLPVGLLFHWISWFGIGLVTLRLWHVMFPAHGKFAVVAALLTLAPVLCKVQFVIVSTVFIDVLSPLLGFVGILLLLAEPPLNHRITFYGAAIFAILVSIVISEYGFATAGVGAVLLSAKWFRERSSHTNRPGILAVLVTVFAASAYALFAFIARSTASAPYRPEFALQSLSANMLMIPVRLLRGIWRGSLGGLLEAMASIKVGNKVALLSFACGVVFSLFVVWAIRHKPQTGKDAAGEWFNVVTLLVASSVALLPFLLMGRGVEDKWDTRFLLPALPVLSLLTVYTLVRVIDKRAWVLVPACCGFLAGYSTTSEFLNTYLHPEPAFAPVQQSESTSKRNLSPPTPQ